MHWTACGEPGGLCGGVRYGVLLLLLCRAVVWFDVFSTNKRLAQTESHARVDMFDERSLKLVAPTLSLCSDVYFRTIFV